MTAKQNVVTNELERNQELAITKKNVETKEALLSLARQQADAEAKQSRARPEGWSAIESGRTPPMLFMFGNEYFTAARTRMEFWVSPRAQEQALAAAQS